MDATQIHAHARRLFEAHGDKAELEAAQKAAECAKSGEEAQARDWKRVQAAISQLRGPLES